MLSNNARKRRGKVERITVLAGGVWRIEERHIIDTNNGFIKRGFQFLTTFVPFCRQGRGGWLSSTGSKSDR